MLGDRMHVLTATDVLAVAVVGVGLVTLALPAPLAVVWLVAALIAWRAHRA